MEAVLNLYMKPLSEDFTCKIFKQFALHEYTSETLYAGFSQMVCEEVAKTLALAKDVELRDAPQSIHAIRVSFKHLRAYWQLISPALSKKELKTANQRVRNAAKLLAQHRDLQVMLESLQQMETIMAEKVLSRSEQAYLQSVKADFEVEIHKQSELLPEIDWLSVEQALEQELAAWQTMSVEKDFMDILQQGMQKTLSNCHGCALRAITIGASSEERHEWRKWVKYGYYQLKLLMSLGSNKGKKVARKLDQLGNLLGKEHDFELLYLYLKSLKKQIKKADAQEKASHKALQQFTKKRLAHLKKQVNHLHSELLKSW